MTPSETGTTIDDDILALHRMGIDSSLRPTRALIERMVRTLEQVRELREAAKEGEIVAYFDPEAFLGIRVPNQADRDRVYARASAGLAALCGDAGGRAGE